MRLAMLTVGMIRSDLKWILQYLPMSGMMNDSGNLSHFDASCRFLS